MLQSYQITTKHKLKVIEHVNRCEKFNKFQQIKQLIRFNP